MNILRYIKDSIVFLIFYIINLVVIITLVFLDAETRMEESNLKYLIIILLCFLFIYLAIDYSIKTTKTNKFKRFASQNTPEYVNYRAQTSIENEYIQALIRLQQEYKSLLDDIEQLKQEELDFITSWIHDIKVPISSMRLQLEKYKENVNRDFTMSLEEELSRIENDIEKVMYFIRVNDFSNDYLVKEVSIENLVHQALKKYARFFSYKKISLSLSNLDVKVLTDKKWSEFIVSQILSNAVKYVDNNGKISVTTESNNSSISLIIKDNGRGIKKEDLYRVFNRGFTGFIGREGNKATGYGMYLSKRLADKMGHKLTVDSKFNEYTIFSLTYYKDNSMYNVTKV